jgi:hypothetical protein
LGCRAMHRPLHNSSELRRYLRQEVGNTIVIARFVKSSSSTPSEDSSFFESAGF